MSEADIPKTFHFSTPTTMKAVICEKHGEKLKICQLPVPVPNDDEVLVKIRASGICHTDVHVCSGDMKSMLPVCPGHEGAGDVVAVGSRVISHVVGDRVGIPWLGSSCGSCEQCVAGWETLCSKQKNTGFSTDGCLREYATCKASHAIPLPPGISYEQAAPTLCAGLTSYKALKESETRPGEWMTIIGAAGGLGHLAVQYAKVMGMRVVAMDVGMTKSKQCLDLGAEAFVDAKSEDPVAQILAITEGGSHGVVVVAPSNTAFQTGVQVVRSRGTMVMVALPPGSFPLPIKDVIMRRITIRGSIVGTRQDMHEAIAFVTRGLVHCNVETDSLDHAQDVLDKLKRNEIEGRVVVDMSTAAAAAVEATTGLVEGVVGEVKREEASMLKKMEGILNDYAGNGGETVTMGGKTEQK